MSKRSQASTTALSEGDLTSEAECSSAESFHDDPPEPVCVRERLKRAPVGVRKGNMLFSSPMDPDGSDDDTDSDKSDFVQWSIVKPAQRHSVTFSAPGAFFTRSGCRVEVKSEDVLDLRRAR
ncbi:MAG: uncharacterized protein KVP18_002325 [Porospora cf. gigantea A]|uniref:uncharacterized protein n=1 Tax=Porospora cf. gigantea A TaxID=2853593 RepID=UPI003559C0D9|nr:MAG: hypothetical protein KVP18_002325 [Porospora cf. gigantea A]